MTRITVPVLTPVAVTLEADPNDLAEEPWVIFLQYEVPEPDAWPSGLVLIPQPGQRRAGFLQRGRYTLRVSSSAQVPSVELNGRPLVNEPEETKRDSFRATIDVGAEPLEIKVRIVPEVVITGQVIDVNSRGVSGSAVHLADSYVWRNTDSDGQFRFSLFQTPLTLEFFGPDPTWVMEPARWTVENAEQAKTPILIRAAQEKGYLFELHVVDPNGNPVEGATVRSNPECPGKEVIGIKRKTDPQGTAAWPCIPGCQADFYVEPKGDLAGFHQPKQDQKCPERREVTLSPGRILRGQVVDKRRLPVEGLQLRGGEQDLWTDQEGRFRFGPLKAGFFEIELNSPPWVSSGKVLVLRNPQKGESAFPIHLTIPEKGSHPELELELVPCGYACLETVDRSGKPCAVENLFLYKAPDLEKPIETRYLSSIRQKAVPGRICTSKMPEGRYYLKIGGAGVLPLWWPGTEEVGQASEVKISTGKALELGAMTVTPVGSLVSLLPEGIELADDQLQDAEAVLERISPQGAQPAAGAGASPQPERLVREKRWIGFFRTEKNISPQRIQVEISQIPEGTFRVILTIPGYRNGERRWFELPEPVTITPPKRTWLPKGFVKIEEKPADQ